MAMFTQICVAPGCPVAAHYVDLSIRAAQPHQQIMQKVKLLDVIILFVTCSMVAKEMIQLRDGSRNILIPNPIDNVDTFTGVKVIEPQSVLCFMLRVAECGRTHMRDRNEQK